MGADKKDRYCCNHGSECRPHRLRPRSGEEKKGRVAFATLLMMGDAYLPGVVLLGIETKRLAPSHDRVCLVTPDVSEQARGALQTVYDHVIEVPYIAIDEGLIRNKEVARVYSRTFTKLHALGLTQYDKVVMIDADMLPLRNLEDLTRYPAPSAVFVACRRPWASTEDLRDYKKIACRVPPGERIPPQLAKRACRQIPGGLTVETSVFVVAPSSAAFREAVALLRAAEARRAAGLLRGDTALMAHLFRGKWHSLDMRYLARWVGEDHPEVFMVDSYGNQGKPWDVLRDPSLFEEMQKYPDVVLWWKVYRDRLARRPALRQQAPALGDLYDLLRRGS